MANTLADVRKEFVKISRRFDLITSGDLSTNTDNGANRFVNLGQRWLDRRTKRRDRLKKFLKVLAASDYTFTLPKFSEFRSFRMLTATGEFKLTDKQMTIEAFRDTYGRPYTDWINGKPLAWAINNDLMSPDIQGSIPQSALGQQDTRTIIHTEEMLRNESFVDGLANASASGYTVSAAIDYKTEDAEYWQLDAGGGAVTSNWFTDGYYAIDATYAIDDTIISQGVGLMLSYPDANEIYTATVVISNYTSGSVVVGLGDAELATISAEGTFTQEIRPTTYATAADANFRIVSKTAGTVKLRIDSVSLKRINVQDPAAHSISIPEDDQYKKEGVIFYPPSEEATTAEFSAFFYTPDLSIDTDRNYWTVNHEDLLALAAALQAEKRLGSGSRIDYFLKAMEVDLRLIDEEEIQWEMDGWDTRDYMGRLGK